MNSLKYKTIKNPQILRQSLDKLDLKEGRQREEKWNERNQRGKQNIIISISKKEKQNVW